ncbi:unnamed protein product, partial [Chrysoparadoxa australica]
LDPDIRDLESESESESRRGKATTMSGDATDGSDLQKLSELMHSSLDIKDRKYHLSSYKKCFVGKDAVEWMLRSGVSNSEEDAVSLGQLLIENGDIAHVTKDHSFANDNLFYRFARDETDHGSRGPPGGASLSWAALGAGLMPTSSTNLTVEVPQSNLANVVHWDESMKMDPSAWDIGVQPLDEHNIHLLDNVHPPEWLAPEPQKMYNLVVLGAGSGGLVSAAGSAGVGARVALIEDHLMGGDCLNVGCVPSKALIKAASVAHSVKNCAEFGVRIKGEVEVDFGAVMERMRRLRAGISHHDSCSRFSKDLGIDVHIGRGKFISPNAIEVNGKVLNFKKAIVATGGTPSLPPIEGLKEAPYMTNSSVFNLTKLPPRLIVIGGGPIGLELAQAFARFGSQVTVLRSRPPFCSSQLNSRPPAFFPSAGADAAKVVLDQLIADGLQMKFNVEFKAVTFEPAEGDGFPTIHVKAVHEGKEVIFDCEALLIATGRKPNVEGIGLEVAGIEYSTREGVKVKDTLYTTNSNVLAVGDCCTRYQFTHVSDFMARIAIRNALFFGNSKFSSLLIPWATFTEPEVSHVGLYPRDLEERKIEYDTYTRYFKASPDVDRAILESETQGFVKIHVKKGTQNIIGATIVGEGAGNMISEISVAMGTKVGLGTLAGIIHPYPTTAEAVRQVGDMYNKTRLTPMVKGLFRNLMKV